MDKEHRNDSHFDDLDPMTDFLFGRSMGSNERKNEGDADPNFKERKQQADDWFIGKRSRSDGEKEKNSSDNEEIPFADLLNRVDIEKLADSIDTLMTTASQFKPLIKQVTPLIKKWIK